MSVARICAVCATPVVSHNRCQHCSHLFCAWIDGKPSAHFAYICMDCGGYMRCANVGTSTAAWVGTVKVSHGLCPKCEDVRNKANCTCGPVTAGSNIEIQTCDWCRSTLDFKTVDMHERKLPIGE